MLDIILHAGMSELATISGVGTGARESIASKLLKGDTGIASVIDSKKSGIEKTIEKVNNAN